MAGRLSKGLRAATFLSIAIVVLAGGCDHPRSTPEDATAASYEVLHTLIGKQVTIRGTFSLRGKFGPYVLLGNQQVVYLVPRGIRREQTASRSPCHRACSTRRRAAPPVPFVGFGRCEHS